jgi:hypothetical protein
MPYRRAETYRTNPEHMICASDNIKLQYTSAEGEFCQRCAADQKVDSVRGVEEEQVVSDHRGQEQQQPQSRREADVRTKPKQIKH